MANVDPKNLLQRLTFDICITQPNVYAIKLLEPLPKKVNNQTATSLDEMEKKCNFDDAFKIFINAVETMS